MTRIAPISVFAVIQKHLEHIYEKLGVRSRTEAAARWYVGSSYD